MENLNPAFLGFLQAIQNSPQYPTKEEILAEPTLEYNEVVIDILKTFKRKWQICSISEERFYVLKEMAKDIGVQYEKNPVVELGTLYCYQPSVNTIVLGPEPSIISTLHELGHAIFGASEKDACRFSVHLFRMIFPKAYDRLQWDGHMLKRKEVVCRVK